MYAGKTKYYYRVRSCKIEKTADSEKTTKIYSDWGLIKPYKLP